MSSVGGLSYFLLVLYILSPMEDRKEGKTGCVLGRMATKKGAFSTGYVFVLKLIQNCMDHSDSVHLKSEVETFSAGPNHERIKTCCGLCILNK